MLSFASIVTETNEEVEYKKLSCLCEKNCFEILIVSIFTVTSGNIINIILKIKCIYRSVELRVQEIFCI